MPQQRGDETNFKRIRGESMKNNTQPALKERIEKALEDFTKGRASMHVPPLDTDVDMVLAECSDRLSELEARCAALAAENAGLKAGSGFFMYSEETGFEFHKTKTDAIKSAEDMIGVCREEACSEGWPEDTESICWGVIMQKATEADFEKPSEENGWIGWSEFSLAPSIETPATDAFLAEVRAQGVKSLSNAVQSVISERQRQQSVEGWTPKHDDRHDNNELAFAASCYAFHSAAASWDFEDDGKPYDIHPAPKNWPWSPEWWKPTNPRRDLVKAGALILAEIERIDRKEAAQ